MASALDEDTAETLADGRATIGSMLSAAQSHLKRVFLVFVVLMMGTIWALRVFLWDQLKEDLLFDLMDPEIRAATEIVAITPFDVILLQIKVGLIAGGLGALPVLIWYSRDGLRERGYWPSTELARWKVWSFGVMIFLLFLGGVAYGYYVFFPVMFEFLAANAVQSGFEPTYSIVMWTEFMVLLTISFGVAAQLPLGMSSAARVGVVKYETFRDKWRYAVVAIFVFGAMFSPPDPFTQVMWGVPLVTLYFVSLGITRLAVVSKRADEAVPIRAVARDHWNHVVGTLLVGTVGVFAYLQRGGLAATNDLLIRAGSAYRVPEAGDVAAFGLPASTVAGVAAVIAGSIAAGVLLFYLRLNELARRAREREAEPDVGPDDESEDLDPGEPAEIDIGAMPARAIENAPTEAFLGLSEERALQYAETAVENDNPDKAEAIFDRFDDAQELEATRAEEREEDEEENFVAARTAGMLDPFTEAETTEDDIGGYYYDIAFILDSLTSKTIWVVGTFMAVLAGSFLFLYQGGIGRIKQVFFSNLPPQMTADVDIVTLHPVEALLFMLKFSTLLAAVSVLPIVLYFAWPAIEERGFSSGGNRDVLLVWGGLLVIALGGGSLLGFFYIAPGIISWLAFDALTSHMVIAYRINSFGWLVIYLTVGIGVLAIIPTTMVLFHHGNIVSYGSMRKRWRGVVLAFFAVAGFLSPNGIFTMLIVAIPVALTYGAGLGLLWLYTRAQLAVTRVTGSAAQKP